MNNYFHVENKHFTFSSAEKRRKEETTRATEAQGAQRRQSAKVIPAGKNNKTASKNNWMT